MVTVQDTAGGSSSSNKNNMSSSSSLSSGWLWIRAPKSRTSSVGSGSITKKPLLCPTPGKVSVWTVGGAENVPRPEGTWDASGGAVMGSAAAAWRTVDGVRMVIEGRLARVAGEVGVVVVTDGLLVASALVLSLTCCRRCRFGGEVSAGE